MQPPLWLPTQWTLGSLGTTIFILIILLLKSYRAQRQRKSGAPLPVAPTILIVEGVIGAGKSTFVARAPDVLAAEFGPIVVVKEPVDRWLASGILQRFYADPPKYAYAFQTFAYATRVEAFRLGWLEALRTGARLLLVERSPFTDRLFMELQFESGTVGGELRPVYESWVRAWDFLSPEALTKVSTTMTQSFRVFLKPSIEICQTRVAARGREGESKVDDVYQQRLLRIHEAAFEDRHPGEYPRLPRIDPARTLVVEVAGAETDYGAVCRDVARFLRARGV